MSGPRPTIFAGRYEIIEELARGGMGRVLLARDRFLGRRVAIKTLIPGNADDADRLRFVEEAQITGQLDHPSIVPVHELGREGEELFLAMKFVEGRDLKALLRAMREPDEDTVDGSSDDHPATAGERRAAKPSYGLRRLLRLFLRVCEAVAFAHDRGVIHRDLKPANVMIGRDDEVLVMDWGLAKPLGSLGAGSAPGDAAAASPLAASSAPVLSDARAASAAELTAKGAVVGTPAYMPPEQAEPDAKLDARADVYSLGAILYEILTLRPPYEGGFIQVMAALARGGPPPPRKRAPRRQVPIALEGVCLRAMEQSPADRYADASALAADVRAHLDGRAVSAYRESFGEAFARLRRTHRTVLRVASFAAGLVAVAVVAATLWLWREEGRLAEVERTAAAAEASAESAREENERQRVRADRLGAAAAEAAEALRLVADFEADVRSGRSLELLPERHRTVLDGIESAAATIREGLDPDDPEERAARASYLGEDGELRGEAWDGALSQAYLRANVALVELGLTRFLPEVDEWLEMFALGDEVHLLRARRLHRQFRDRAAVAVLDDALASVKDEEVRAVAAAFRAHMAWAPLEESRPRIVEAVARRPSHAWLRLVNAERLIREGRIADAREEYARALRLAPTDAWTYFSRWENLIPIADAHQQTLANERKLIRKLAARFPGSVGPYERLFQVWSHGQEQLDRLRKGVAVDVERGRLSPLHEKQLLARASAIAHRWEDAARLAGEALALDAEDRIALGIHAAALGELGRLEQAEAVARRGLALYPDDGRLNGALGEALRRGGRTDDAVVDRLERGARSQLDPLPWRRLAECLAAREDDPAAWERGIEAAREALARSLHDVWIGIRDHAKKSGGLFPPFVKDPALVRVFAGLRMRQGRWAAAALHALRAQSFELHRAQRERERPSFADTLLAAEAHERLELFEEAVLFYDQVRERDPVLRAEAERRIAAIRRR